MKTSIESSNEKPSTASSCPDISNTDDEETKKDESTKTSVHGSDAKKQKVKETSKEPPHDKLDLQDIVDQSEKRFGLENDLESSPVHKCFCKDLIEKNDF